MDSALMDGAFKEFKGQFNPSDFNDFNAKFKNGKDIKAD